MPATAAQDTPGVNPEQLSLGSQDRMVHQYLAKGRRELNRGNPRGAAYWYEQAAGTDVKFNADEDSPAKLMQDIRKAGGEVRDPATIRSASPTAAQNDNDLTRFAPTGTGTGDDAVSPYDFGTEHPLGNLKGYAPSPEDLDADTADLPSGLNDADDAAHRQSDQLLLAARQAMSYRDLRRAAMLVDQAKGLSVLYTAQEDTPQKVEKTLATLQAIEARLATGASSESFRRSHARVMMEQSEALLQWGDLDNADRLAQEAARQNVVYGQFEMTPDALLKRIATMRRDAHEQGQLGAAGASPSPAAMQHPPMGAALPSVPTAATPMTPEAMEAAMNQAMQLVAQAREKMARGDLVESQRLAEQAVAMNVPGSKYSELSDSPWQVLLDIRRAQRTTNRAAVFAGNDPGEGTGSVTQADYEPTADTSHNQPASSLSRSEGVEGMTQPLGPRLQRDSASTPPGDFSRDLDIPFRQGNFDPAVPRTDASPPSALQGPQPSPTRLPGTPPLGPNPESEASGQTPESSKARQLLTQGELAMQKNDETTALLYFRQAAQFSGELSNPDQQRLTQHIARLQEEVPAGETGTPDSLLRSTQQQQQLKARQATADLSRAIRRAQDTQQVAPKESLELLLAAKKEVEQSGLDSALKDQLLRRLKTEISLMERFIEENRSRIALDETNQETLNEISRHKAVKIEVQDRIAQLVNEFNELMDQQRYPEAELKAKEAAQLDPEASVVAQLAEQVRFVRHHMNNRSLKEMKEDGFMNAMHSVDTSSVPFDDSNPYQMPNIKQWTELTNRRESRNRQEGVRRTEKELEIEQKLRTPVQLQYEDVPLGEVMRSLGDYADVNLHLDPQGLAEEGVTTDTPITINLREEISLKSAINLILRHLNLTYVIQDEVLLITSEHLRDFKLVTVTYNVADLVIPIPNFVPSNRMGLSSSLNDAYDMIANRGYTVPPGFGPQAPVAVMADNVGSQDLNKGVMAQGPAASVPGLGGGSGFNGPTSFGPGGAGGGVQADFDTLIDLIVSTIEPTSWDEVGGPGAIEPFPTNLSLVISQREDVHEEIVDLLDQLRRLQDLQVTIEVRFITLNDNFFERIGIDFDFDIDDDIDKEFQVFGNPDPAFTPTYTSGTGVNPLRDLQDRDHLNDTLSVGMSAPGVFSTDLDIPFRQGNFDLAVPQFGGFDPTAGAQLGFAILSDLEAFFFISAAQGDRRSNVLQAPKVTLFNGQSAFVADTSQSPFVISVIPVVGDFAAALQPVIVVLSEGTFLTVQATVSPDRRFVRLTVVPFFSDITEVNTFTFNGTMEEDVDTSEDGPDDDRQENNIRRTVSSGTTVQLPTFAFISVATTVSVPDGGSVLLGGIKRLSEGRNEFGVPFLNKLPYINRLFKNVSIGRETQSLMMMVTPRIIIQEEEEALMGS
jgi:general secretion pathway protein D